MNNNIISPDAMDSVAANSFEGEVTPSSSSSGIQSSSELKIKLIVEERPNVRPEEVEENPHEPIHPPIFARLLCTDQT